MLGDSFAGLWAQVYFLILEGFAHVFDSTVQLLILSFECGNNLFVVHYFSPQLGLPSLTDPDFGIFDLSFQAIILSDQFPQFGFVFSDSCI